MTARNAIVIFTVAVFAGALLLASLAAPGEHAPLGAVADVYARRTVAETTAVNVVAAINFDWRAYDTIGEATILLTAATGVTLLLRRYLERRRETGIT